MYSILLTISDILTATLSPPNLIGPVFETRPQPNKKADERKERKIFSFNNEKGGGGPTKAGQWAISLGLVFFSLIKTTRKKSYNNGVKEIKGQDKSKKDAEGK
jgi:hypothetical protein